MKMFLEDIYLHLNKVGFALKTTRIDQLWEVKEKIGLTFLIARAGKKKSEIFFNGSILMFLSACMKREMLTLHRSFYLLPLIHGLPNYHNIDNLFRKMSGPMFT